MAAEVVGAEATSTRASLLEALVGETAAHADTVLASLRDEMQALGAFEGLGEFESADVLGSIGWTFATFMECLAAGRPFTVAELERIERNGRMRARQGATLEMLSRTLRLGIRYGFGQFVRIASQRSDPETLKVLGDVAVAVLDLALDASEALARGHAMEGQQQLTTRSRAQRGLAEGVLDGSADEDALRARAHDLGLRLHGHCGMVVAVPCDSIPRDLHPVVDALVGALPGGIEGPARSLPSPHAAMIVPHWCLDESIIDDLERLAIQHTVALVVADRPNLHDLGKDYRRLRPHVHLVAQVTGGPGVLPIGDLVIYELIGGAAPEAAEAFLSDSIGPLLDLPDQRRASLLDTISALHRAGGQVSVAAEHMHLHPRTVRYRRETIRELTGLDLGDASDLMTASLAIHLLRLHSH